LNKVQEAPAATACTVKAAMHAPHLAGQLLLSHMPAADKTMQTTTVPTIVQQSDSCNIDEQQCRRGAKSCRASPAPAAVAAPWFTCSLTSCDNASSRQLD